MAICTAMPSAMRCRAMWMASTTSWSVPMGCVFARTASIEPLKPIKINNLDWQLCQERAIIVFDAIVAPN